MKHLDLFSGIGGFALAAEQVFGDKKPHPTCDYYKNLNLYDLRHSSAIHFRLLAKENPAEVSLDAVRHRFGWSDFTMLNYYSQFLGMDGKIDKVGMLLKQDKHKIEKDLDKLKKENQLMKQSLADFGNKLLEMQGKKGRVELVNT